MILHDACQELMRVRIMHVKKSACVNHSCRAWIKKVYEIMQVEMREGSKKGRSELCMSKIKHLQEIMHRSSMLESIMRWMSASTVYSVRTCFTMHHDHMHVYVWSGTLDHDGCFDCDEFSLIAWPHPSPTLMAAPAASCSGRGGETPRSAVSADNHSM